MVLVDQNPMCYILNRQVLGGKYSCWIVILQEFDLEFAKATSKKSLVFVELMCDLPCAFMDIDPSDSFPDEFLFLISTTDPWYGDLIIYLQTQRFQPNKSRDDCHRIRHHVKYYLILNNTLYKCGIYSILQRCFTHEEAEQVLNYCHSGACVSHLFGMAIVKNVLCTGYLSP